MLQAGTAAGRKIRAECVTRRPSTGAGSQAAEGSSMAATAGKPAVVLRRSSSSTSTEGSLTLDNKVSVASVGACVLSRSWALHTVLWEGAGARGEWGPSGAFGALPAWIYRGLLLQHSSRA